jgi:glycine oxidase
VRLFQDDHERRHFAARRGDVGFQAQLCAPQPEPLVDAAVVAAEGGGFAMVGAQLDVGAFLAATRAHVAVDTMEVDWVRDVSFEAAGVRLGTHRARRVVSCEGYGAVQNPYLRHLRFNAARGDILTLRIRGLALRQILHRGIWLAPTMDPEIFNAGATYDLKMLDAVPSAAGRVEIEGKLKALLRVPFTVVAHQGAVRPILLPNEPVFGLHPAQPQLGFFNGLGSKGSLLAPASAAQFAAMLPGDA